MIMFVGFIGLKSAAKCGVVWCRLDQLALAQEDPSTSVFHVPIPKMALRMQDI